MTASARPSRTAAAPLRPSPRAMARKPRAFRYSTSISASFRSSSMMRTRSPMRRKSAPALERAAGAPVRLFKHLPCVGGKLLPLLGGEDVGNVRDRRDDLSRSFLGDREVLGAQGLEPRAVD